MRRPRFRLLFEWPDYEQALRDAAARRQWNTQQVEAALQRDRICTVEVDDVEAHLDWHERLGFEAPMFRSSQG
ncbi:MAG: hypothetical protein ACREQY_08265 [Candidatus Binatia bacterium]